MAQLEPVKIEIRILGGAELRAGDGSAARPRNNKVKALLACLALAAGKPVPRQKLMTLLWSNRGIEQARGSLRQALAELRQILGEPAALIANNETVALDSSIAAADAVEFERLIGAGRWAEACAVYRGDLLDGVVVKDAAFDKWLTAERQRLQAAFVRALTEVMEKASRDGDNEAAGEAAQRLLQQDPLHEAACRRLMLVLADRGQRSQAFKVHDALRERLRLQKAEPEAATTEVYERIRQRLSAPPATKAAPDNKPSIAVLPFLNLSDDPAQQHFSDGISEDIISGLSMFREVVVIARTSSFGYRGRALSVPQIGRELGVTYVLEGSVRRAGNRVRITAQLIDAVSGKHVWTERHDRESEDIFALQDEITEAVVGTVAGRIGQVTIERSRHRSPANLGSHDLFLQGREQVYRFSPASLAEARKLLAAAIAADPRNAAAQAWLAEAHWAAWYIGCAEDPAGSFAKAAALTERALSLDDSDSHAQSERTQILLYLRRFDEARFHLERAIQLNHYDPDVIIMQVFWALFAGDKSEAAAKIADLDRLDPFGHYGLVKGMVAYVHADYTQAIRCLQTVRGEFPSTHAWLAACHARAGDPLEAAASAEKYIAAADAAARNAGGTAPGSWLEFFKDRHPFHDPVIAKQVMDGLSAAGLR